jgi:hypothetical protein
MFAYRFGRRFTKTGDQFDSRVAGISPAVIRRACACKVRRCASGGKGGPYFRRSGSRRAGHDSKIHAIAEGIEVWVLILTPGNTADCVMAQEVGIPFNPDFDGEFQEGCGPL